MAITNEYQPIRWTLEITKGSGNQSIEVQTGSAKMFQPTTDTTRATHGMKAGVELDKVVRIKRPWAALGWRGDYISLSYTTVATGTTTWAMLLNSVLLDVADFSGVMPNIQTSKFGKYSPFGGAKGPVLSKSEFAGIDRQDFTLECNIAPTADGTAKSQYVHTSTADSRVTATATGATTAVTKLEMRMTPNSDGVFFIPPNARIWLGSGTPT